jgi:DNA-binding PadR family transcriptional regulator
MYSDNTLTPKEATRLCALGTLGIEPMRYSALATSVRHFISRILGPSLDLLTPSIELLKYEGLVKPTEGSGMDDDATLSITDKGRDELHSLLTADMRSGASELNKLIVALKFRFMHLLGDNDRQLQADLLIDVCEEEIARLVDLKESAIDDGGFLSEWLDQDISEMESRLSWLGAFRVRLTR